MTSGADDLAVWLAAQMDEDERGAEAAAREAAAGPMDNGDSWTAGGPYGETVTTAEYGGSVAVGAWTGYLPDAIRLHIAEHDPARELREVEAKRLLLDLHKHCPASCYVLRVLALPYEHRIDYREEWRP